MTRRINEVDHIVQAVAVAVSQPHRLRLDGDPALAFDVHLIKELLTLFALRQSAGDPEQTVSEGRLTMVDVGDDREVTNSLARDHGVSSA